MFKRVADMTIDPSDASVDARIKRELEENAQNVSPVVDESEPEPVVLMATVDLTTEFRPETIAERDRIQREKTALADQREELAAKLAPLHATPSLALPIEKQKEYQKLASQSFTLDQNEIKLIDSELEFEHHLHMPDKRAIYNKAAGNIPVVSAEVTKWMLTPGDGFLSDNPEEFGSFIPQWINRHPKYLAAQNAIQNAEAAITQSENLIRGLTARREILMKQLDAKRARLFAI